MKKRVLLISYNYHPEPTGIGKYNGEQIEWLAKCGYDCTVVTTYPYYPYWKVQEPYNKDRFRFKSETKTFDSGGNIQIYRCPIYVPEKPSGLKRILLDFTFIISAGIQLLRLLFHKRYDVIMTVAPTFLIGLLGVFYKIIRNGKLLYHIQDMQIEAARDLQMIKSDKLINSLFKIETFIFNKSDYISSISDGMVSKIEQKTHKKVLLHPNWADTAQFYPVNDKNRLKGKFGFDSTDRIILYSGAIGEKQGLEAIIHAAKEFKSYKEWKFVICGSGPYKGKLQNLAEELNLQNLIFFPLQPFEKFNDFLNMADVHLVIQKANASDLVMPSKLTTILAVGGLALITANEGSSLFSLVAKHNMGLLVDAENQVALNTGLKKALLSEDNEEVVNNARSYAERYLSIDSIMKSLEASVINPVSESDSTSSKKAKSLLHMENAKVPAIV